MRQFIEGLAAGSLVADVGCGNGKYFMVRQDIAVLGSDRSSGLANVAATRLAAGTGAASGTPSLLFSSSFTLLSKPRILGKILRCKLRRVPWWSGLVVLADFFGY